MNISFNSSENLKINELNQILDKIAVHQNLSKRELDFLQEYDNLEESDFKDFNYLSLLDLFYIICQLKKTVICDIKDKEGKINQQILSIDYVHDDCKIILGLKHGIYTLTDNYLYKLVYQFKHDNYSLDIQNEYYEKIELDR